MCLWKSPGGLDMGGGNVLPTPESNSYTTHLFFGKYRRRMLDPLPLTPYALLDGGCCVADIKLSMIFYDLTQTRENLFPNEPALSRWDQTSAVMFSLLGDQIDQDSIYSYIKSAHPQDKRRIFLLGVIQKLQASTQRTASPLIETLASISR